MKPSAAKVAREWNKTQMAREIEAFEDHVSEFWRTFKSQDRTVGRHWVAMIESGHKLAPWLMETRAVPPGKAKSFEMAVRLFYGTRSTRNLKSWVKRNEKHIAHFEMALRWPEKASADDGGDEVFRHEGFTVHNTVHLEDKKLEATKLAITKSVKAIKSMGVPNASGNIYGNLFIVGRLTSPRTLAWYDKSSDELYVRPHMKVGPGEIHALTHEIGHRYWFKLMQAGKKKIFTEYHRAIARTPRGSIVMPKAGDPVPIPIRGRKTVPTILEDLGHAYTLEGGGQIKKRQLIRILQQEAEQAKFPTPYAATSVSEHFAEAFAMYALGTLSADATEAFKDIVVDGDVHQPEAITMERDPPEPVADPAVVGALEELLAAIRKQNLRTFKRDELLTKVALRKAQAGGTVRDQDDFALTFGLYGVDPPPGWPKAIPPEVVPAAQRVPDQLPTGNALLKMVQELETMARKRRTKKVLKFVEGVVETLEDGGRLGPRREKRLTRLLQSYGLMAGGTAAGRVAVRWLEGEENG